MNATPRSLALAWGLGGGVLAALVMVVPELLARPGGGRLAGYAGLAAGLIAVHLGTRAATTADAGFGARLVNAALLAASVSLLAGLGLYGLFARLRPELLAARFSAYQQSVAASGAPAERIARELARLAASRAQYLDAGYQALSSASTLFFFGMLLGGYGAWRAHRLGRLRWQAPAQR
jgi:hypothetical protein